VTASALPVTVAAQLHGTVLEQTRELRAARDHAMEASQLKSQFLAHLSHEIRTPMTAVIGAADLLETTDLTNEQRGYINIISESGQALLAIITDILDFSKIEAGRLELETSTFGLLEPFAETVRMLGPQASRKWLQLRLDAEPDLPQMVMGDAGRVRQVLTNLVDNAVKFTDVGHVLVTVATLARSLDEVTVRCSVSDTGIGIAEQDISCLFNDFTQVDTSSTRRFGGTGLGLAISDRLVQLMGGEIGCTPNLEGGSTFWFTLPFDLPRSPSSGETDVARNATGSSTSESGTTSEDGPLILIVEDNEINAVILTRMLSLLGYRSDTVRSGADALDAVTREPYATILMDCQMPVMDGFTTTRNLRAQSEGDQRIPIVAITATATTEDQERCLAAGMDDYLPKPFTMQRLAAVLDCWAPGPSGAAIAEQKSSSEDP
jgi:two-component system, sensor histidine kinase